MSGLLNESGKRVTHKKKVESTEKQRKPSESIVDKYYGAFKVEKWPDDLDGFIVEALQEWRSNRTHKAHTC